MSAIHLYLQQVQDILRRAEQTQAAALEQAAQALARATEKGANVFAFGCNHAGLLAMELFYRTGGLVTVNPVRAPGLNLDISPVTMTTEMERMEEYGAAIFRNMPVKAGDVLLIHSVSGRNGVTVQMALDARKMGITVIALTNMATTTREKSRHSSGKNLYECADIVVDNCGCYGDAALKLEGFEQKVAPTSTAVGAALLNAVVARAVELLIKRGVNAPVFISSNVVGGDEHNAKILDQYKGNIFYM